MTERSQENAWVSDLITSAAECRRSNPADWPHQSVPVRERRSTPVSKAAGAGSALVDGRDRWAAGRSGIFREGRARAGRRRGDSTPWCARAERRTWRSGPFRRALRRIAPTFSRTDNTRSTTGSSPQPQRPHPPRTPPGIFDGVCRLVDVRKRLRLTQRSRQNSQLKGQVQTWRRKL